MNELIQLLRFVDDVILISNLDGRQRFDVLIQISKTFGDFVIERVDEVLQRPREGLGEVISHVAIDFFDIIQDLVDTDSVVAVAIIAIGRLEITVLDPIFGFESGQRGFSAKFGHCFFVFFTIFSIGNPPHRSGKHN